MTEKQQEALDSLAAYIERMPGGKYIGDKWRDEPLELYFLSIEDPHITAKWAIDAYETANAGNVTALAVPSIVGHMLEWYADEYVHWATQGIGITGTDAVTAVHRLGTVFRHHTDVDVHDMAELAKDWLAALGENPDERLLACLADMIGENPELDEDPEIAISAAQAILA